MTQILFTIAIIVVVLYGSKLLTSARAKTRVPPEERRAPVRPSEDHEHDRELQKCPVCGTYSVEVSPYGCPECRGKKPDDGAA